MSKPDNLIELCRIADRHNKHLSHIRGDFRATRDWLLRKLMEELGEYCDAVNLDEGESKRKLRKYGVLDRNDVIDSQKWDEVTRKQITEEVTDIFYVALRILRLEKVSVETALSTVRSKKEIL